MAHLFNNVGSVESLDVKVTSRSTTFPRKGLIAVEFVPESIHRQGSYQICVSAEEALDLVLALTKGIQNINRGEVD